MKTGNIGVRGLSDTYFKLVKQFPLTHLRDAAHVEAAQAFLDELLEEKLDAGAQAYVDVLTDLVEAFEDGHEPFPCASEADVLRELLRVNGLSQPQAAKKVGISQSTISAVLNGARSLTKDQVIRLAKFFRVSPGAFLPD